MFLIAGALNFSTDIWTIFVVKLVMRKYSSENLKYQVLEESYAKRFDRFSLKDVKVEVTELGDHYDD